MVASVAIEVRLDAGQAAGERGGLTLKLSVTMATCNGVKYVQAQLDSLVSQSRRPDELIVTDDCSDDGTAEIVDRFAEAAPFPVVIRRNPARLGYIRNFEQAIGMATGDVILLADQDDVWHPNKLARHEAAYQTRPEIGAVIGDAAVVGSDLEPLGYSLWQHMGLHPSRVAKFRTGRGLDLYIKRGLCYGVLLSFQSKYRDVLTPFPLNFSHDDWITIILSAVTRFELIAEPLIDYRQHSGQLIGVGLFTQSPGSDGSAAQDHFSTDLALDRVDTFEERIRAFPDRWIRPDVMKVIQGRRAYLKRRRSMAGRNPVSRLLVMTRNLVSGDYLRFGSYPKRDLLADLRGR